MNVAVNLAYLRPGGVGGSEVYVRRLLQAMAGFPDVRLTLFCNGQAAPTFDVGEVVQICADAYSLPRRLWAENWSLRRFLRAAPVDVLFSPGNFAAPLLPARIPQVVTVHDLQHLWLPENFTRAKRLQRSTMFRLSLRRCRRIIAISEFTRGDVIERFGVPPAKIVTVLEGVDRAAAPDAAFARATGAKFALPATFFYYPATDAPHKNHATLIEALADLHRRAPQLDAALVFSGERGRGYEKIRARAAALDVSERVHHLGFVTHEEVFALLQLARALVFPSEFEGFGLPPLEAMQCDTPVLASRCASIPEVVGDGGELLPPRDVGAWRDAMHRVLTDIDWRRELIERGRRNVARFSWQRCAEQTLAVLRAAAGGQR